MATYWNIDTRYFDPADLESIYDVTKRVGTKDLDMGIRRGSLHSLLIDLFVSSIELGDVVMIDHQAFWYRLPKGMEKRN